jgi:crotonobetainyl-CoA:carnitine CoA-transferase CaiB-like acyl-CoA transferase
MARRGALDGLRVVDFSWWMAGPLATMVLADNGAEVIKVEPPAGDPARTLPAFQTWNRGKQSVVLDLKTDGDREVARKLIVDADVVVTSFRPGVAERLGIGYADVRALSPRAVYAAITGYGEDGPRSTLKGYEALATARSGRAMMFERVADRDGPAFPVLPCASYTAAMLTAQGILAALHQRESTGRGQKVSVSLLSSLMLYDLIMWIGWQLRGEDIEAEGQTAPMMLQKLMGERQMLGSSKPRTYDPAQMHRPKIRVPRPNYLTAATKDGVWLQFANTIDRLCVAQMTALGLLDLYGEERFAKLPAVAAEDDAEELWETVLERVREKTYEEWLPLFEAQPDLAVERVSTPAESMRHRQIVHNGSVVEVQGPDGRPTLQPGPIARFSATPSVIGEPAPSLDKSRGSGFNLTGGGAGQVSAGSPLAPPVGLKPDPPGKAAPPLEGITVIDFSAWIAAPLATAMLANLGARVIKVEPVGGDMSRYSTGGLLSFPMTQGKQSISLDLKHPEGREIVRKLIGRADVVVHNFRSPVPERLGIDYESCRALNPALIYLNAASYGDSGPDAGKPMFFATAAAMGGNQLRQVGESHPMEGAEGLPIDDLKQEAWRLLKAAEGNADPIAAVAAATAVLVALRHRDRTGEGQSVLTTMIGSNMYANSDEAIVYDGKPDAPAVDADLLGFGPAYRLYEAAEGWVMLSCVRRNEWDALCDVIGLPELAPDWGAAWDQRCRLTKGAALGVAVAAVLKQRTAAEWEALAEKQDIPLVAVEMRDPGRFNMEDAEMRRLGHAVSVRSPVHGEYRRHGALQTFSDASQTFGPWDPLGGHGEAILRELGYSAGEIARLEGGKVVEVWRPEAK